MSANSDGFARVHGVWAVPELGKVYASVTGNHQVAAVDMDSLKTVARIGPVNYPDGLAYAPFPKRVFVSDEHGNVDAVIDTTTNTLIKNIPLGGGAGNTVYDADSGHILVAVHGKNEIVAIDPSKAEIVGRYPLPGIENPHGIALDLKERLAFIAGEENHKLAVLDLSTMKVLSTQEVGEDPDVLAFDPPKETYWYELMIKALPKPHRGAVVYHTDITELKKARDDFAIILNGARGILWRAKLPGFQTIFTSKHVETILGYSVQAWTTQPDLWVNRIHPEDREWVLAFTARATEEGRSHDFEYRMISADGQTVWLRNIVNVVVENGRPREVVSISVDITERKRAEEALSGIARKLVEAQEQERARIGRELHDDINQRLAMLAVELEQLQDNPSEVRSRVQELRQQTTELSEDVQALSHELHSSKLEYLGVVAGIKSWCKEFTERQKIEIEFTSDVSSTLPSDIGLCLFRVLQEAAHNAVKYSGVKRVQVQLRGESGEIHLIILDSGKGFDVEGGSQGKGLGLTSMRERVRLVNGTIEIKSKPMGGTTIHVRVPLPSEYEAHRAAG